MTEPKTHGLMRRKRWLAAGLVVAGVAVLLLPFLFQSRPTATLKSGGREYRLEIVSSPEARTEGLSGRRGMSPGQGMIFVFDTAATQCIWMKDMRFSLDIVWLDEEKRIVHLEHEVSPETYPQQFCPEQPARYVIELSAGEAVRAGLRVGQTLSI